MSASPSLADDLELRLRDLAALGLAAVVVDLAGVIRGCTPEVSASLALPADLVGRSVSEIAVLETDVTRAVLQLHDTGAWRGDVRLRGVSGPPTGLHVSAALVRHEDGRPVGAIVVLTGLTPPGRLDARLADLQDSWQVTLDCVDARMAVLDQTGTIVAVNQGWRAHLREHGIAGDWVGRSYLEVSAQADEPVAAPVTEALSEVLAGRRTAVEVEYSTAGSEASRGLLARVRAYDTNTGRRIVVSHEPVTPLRLAQEHTMQARLLDELDVSVVITDARRIVLTWNSGAEALYGWTREEAVGSWLPRLVAPNEDLGDFISAGLNGSGRVDGELMARRKDGSILPVYARTRMVAGGDGGPAFYFSVSMDISEHRAAQGGLLRARNHLRAVTDNMGDGLFTIDDEGRILYLNRAAQQALGYTLDQLRGLPVSRLLGGSVAPDQPPQAVPGGLMRALRDRRTVRVEEDDFVRRDGRRLSVSYTAAPFETDDGILGAVVVFQDISGRVAEAEQLNRDLEKLAWVRRVQEALRADGLVLHAQPIVTLDTGEVTQHELLIRLREADEAEPRLIPPAVFLPIAEEYGLIGQIDRWVVDRAVGLAAGGLPVEVNVSAATIGDLSFLDHVELALTRTGADPVLLVFEITETAIMANEAGAKLFVERLHELGCRIALDDFGTGYGGFTYLKHLPVDILKIDIEFVHDLRDSVSSQKVVRAVVDLARGFGLLTVAEGVEDAETLQLLREFGVDQAQGYYTGRPAPLIPGELMARAERA